MSVPAEVAGDIHPQVPGAADSLQHLSMQYILRLERVPGGCHPHDLAHVKFAVRADPKLVHYYGSP